MDDVRPGEARFDAALGAWVLSSYADVSAALREARLVVAGADADASADAHTAHAAVREAAARALSPTRLAAWRAEIEDSARRLVGGLPAERPVELVSAFAAPWSLALAVKATGVAEADAARLATLAREVFLAAACSEDGEVQPTAQTASAELARMLQGAGASADVQAFVALSQTLPCFLAGAWLALARHPKQARELRARPAIMPHAIEELLRYAGPSRAVFRRAAGDLAIGGASIAAGARVILMLSAANRDPAQFAEPDRLDFRRGGAGQLAFGRGAHSCAGAPLVRMALVAATEALLRTTYDVELEGEVEWMGGFAIRGPGSVPVMLRCASL